MTTTVPFINSLSSGVNSSIAQDYHTHDTEREHTHSHGPGEHGHTHEHLDNPGGSFRSLIIRMLMSASHRQILRTWHARIHITKFWRARIHCWHRRVRRTRPYLSGWSLLSDAPGLSALEKLHWLLPSVGAFGPSTTLVWTHDVRLMSTAWLQSSHRNQWYIHSRGSGVPYKESRSSCRAYPRNWDRRLPPCCD
jgi:hypothetical protein